LAKQVKMMFEKKQFAELDAMADKFRKSKSRFPDGVWKLRVFYTGFDQSPNTPEWAFPKYIDFANEWRRARPTSVTAQSVLAGAWMDYAWQARGSGYANKVKEDSWQLVNERLEKAWKIVNEPLAPGVKECPNRLWLRLGLATAMGFEKKKFEALFQEAQKQEPGYYSHYAAKSNYLLPKWHGEEGEWQQFINKVVVQNPRGEGASIYTRTAWRLFPNDWQNFEGSGVSWAKMKAGFAEINRNYPHSPWILNTYAKFACRAGDLDTMKGLFKRIDSQHYYSEAWGRDNIEDCRMWANTGKSKEELGREKFSEHMKCFEVKVFENILGLAEKGNSKVIGDLAEMYLKGRGTSTDPIAAYAWLLQDEITYKEQLAINGKCLTSEQLRQARKKSIVIRSRISQQKGGKE
jgi:hypothetical protein